MIKSIYFTVSGLVFSLFLQPSLLAQTENTKPVQEIEVISKKEMASNVKSAFQHAWKGYKTYAWGYDALKPLSEKGHNWYAHSLLMTPVDAFDTMILMNLKDEAKEVKTLILDSLSFDYDMEVQVFEVSIRVFAGLLSAYELDGDKGFLVLAEDLARRLLKAFDSPTGMPYRFVNLKTGATSGAVSNPAEIGTFLVEFGVLSNHTGNPVYFETAMKAMRSMYSLRSSLNLTPEGVNVETGEITNPVSHISGCIDSYLEYMLKGKILFKNDELDKMWETSLKSVNQYLADETKTVLWYGQADMYSGLRTSTGYGALDAFFAGSLAMSGDLDRAVRLQQSNYSMWMMHGIEPEWMDYQKMEVVNGQYILRPENLESAYYLYHYTKDPVYLEMGKSMFESIEKNCKTKTAYAAVKDVRTMEKRDYMESFFFAETLKYAFLLFDESGSLDFDKVIFNTEAHPYRR